MSESPPQLTIRELEERTGFSARSIHHYISRGLLPGARGSGPAARYGREHLLRLRLIQSAKQAGFRIDQRLQEALDGLGPDEMQELAELAERDSSESNQLFGEWLMTGRWQSGAGTARAKLGERMPATAAMLEPGPRPRAMEAEPVVASMSEAPRTTRGPRASRRPERWERLQIGDALELAWRRPGTDPDFTRKLERLVEVAERLFGSGDRDDEG